MPPPEEPSPLWAEIDGFDRLLEHRSRLGIGVLLARHQALTFRRLKELLNETDGSLGANLAKLEEAGYLEGERTFEGSRPVTWYRLTNRGREAIEGHLRALESLVRTAHAADSKRPRE